MAILWQRKNPPATDARIAQFEAKERLVLPESYKVFLRYANGGLVYDGSILYQQQDEEIMFTLSAFFSLGHISRTLYDLRREPLTQTRDKEGHDDKSFFPTETLLPIGASLGGHELLGLDLASGAVYLWFDETDRIFAASDIAALIQGAVLVSRHEGIS